ncbi:Octamer-binding transcription factor [Quillaja saponaria]|uniref:Octamer-binding transcription factor n=1 Tax=Quillaja saponaria TaxID=32244 RepID=A0AAD7Q5K9_QUISA|nr:Octamer-binding transcription factor [Quillaja saponaria]
MQKAALISNFVDRESERPALRLNDFLPLPVICSAPEIETVYSSRKTRSNLPKKNRPKKCLKEAHMISDEVQDIVNCNEVETSGGYAIHEEQTTEPQPERNHLVEEVLDHSPLPSDLVLMTTNTKGKRLSKLTTRRKKFTESDQESQRCHLVPESPESGTTNDNCRKAISKNTSNKKSGARKQRIRRKVCTVEPREHYRSTESSDKSMFSGSNHNTGYQNDHLSIPDSTHSEEIDKHGWDDSTRKQAASKLHPKSKVHTVADSHSFSSPPESSELKISDAGVGSSLSGTTISKKKGVATNKQSRKVISAELSGNQQKKLKGSNPRGLPSSKQLCGRADGDDITLASFLWNKSKKRKLEATINDTDSCFPSSSKAGSESLSNLETLHVLQDRVPTNTLSPGYPQSDDLRNTASTASVTEPSGADLVKEKNVAPQWTRKRCSVLEYGDWS